MPIPCTAIKKRSKQRDRNATFYRNLHQLTALTL